MDDLISRQDAIDIIDGYMNRLANHIGTPTDNERYAYARGTLLGVETGINALPFIDAVQVIRCKDCKHRPKRLEDGEGEGFNLEFPDDNFKCPCQCDDGWYNWMPADNWFCGNGERKEE